MINRCQKPQSSSPRRRGSGDEDRKSQIYRRIPAFAGMTILLFLLLLPTPSHATIPALNINLADDHVDITTGFNGATMSLFGVRRETGDVVIVVRGPETALTVRRKDQLAGIWMNRQSLTFDDVPVYYDLASSRPMENIAPQSALASHQIGLGGMEFRYSGDEDDATVDKFREALILGRQMHGLFPLEPRRIHFMDNNFFRADFYLPPDVPTGIYTIDSYLFRDGAMVSQRQIPLRVAQVGFNAGVYDFAHNRSILYGLAAIILALATGWASHMAARRE